MPGEPLGSTADRQCALTASVTRENSLSTCAGLRKLAAMVALLHRVTRRISPGILGASVRSARVTNPPRTKQNHFLRKSICYGLLAVLFGARAAFGEGAESVQREAPPLRPGSVPDAASGVKVGPAAVNLAADDSMIIAGGI